ncbi:uncharacterized protein EDB91DRAFT_1243819 [Suillus paluster]|uniref:uncharacterized protein n=1 Tax=Suillus paluster TaxID=48578 RepID=UPI001B864F87|nr:uncharacterized protein EDB91DRAFT_1243819 [Suillus paluster]KAG1751572.1 hypothetical protein EDB91DRAFT_1243819 [Suillus paluster]
MQVQQTTNPPKAYDDDPGAYQSSLENTLVNGSTPSPRPPPPRASAGVYQSSESDSDPDPDDDMPLDALRNKTKHVSEKRKTDAMSSSDQSSFGEGSDITPQPPQQKRLKRTKGHRLARRSIENNSRCDTESLAFTSHLDGLPPLVSPWESAASSSTTDEELLHTPHESPKFKGIRREKTRTYYRGMKILTLHLSAWHGVIVQLLI